ncbi:MAG TPA: DUF3303 family protein [Dehalococcoidia bacterium]|jgi:hypothetical protein|nr:DUF3303 family protein [Dehalococcoidia bacterium]
MLFAITYHRRPNASEADTKQLIRIFMAWAPPEGIEVLSHYHYARGGGGVVIAKATDTSHLFEALTTFDGSLEFEMEPVLNVIEAVAIKMDVDAWVSSLPTRGRPSQLVLKSE